MNLDGSSRTQNFERGGTTVGGVSDGFVSILAVQLRGQDGVVDWR